MHGNRRGLYRRRHPRHDHCLRIIADQANADLGGGLDIDVPTDPIAIYFKIALYIAIGFATPVLLWQVIGFLSPGLTRKEKRLLFTSLPFVSILFIAGASYAFFFCCATRVRLLFGSSIASVQVGNPTGREHINA